MGKKNILMAMTLLMTAMLYGAEVLQNGSFQNGECGHWGVKPPALSIEKLASPVDGNDYAARMVSEATGKRLLRLIYREDIMLEPGALYELSFWHKTRGAMAAQVRFQLGKQVIQRPLPLAEEWKKTSVDITVPPDHSAGILDFFYRPGAAGETWLTGISLNLKGKADYRSGTEWLALMTRVLGGTGWQAVPDASNYAGLSRGLLTEWFRKTDERLLFGEWINRCRTGVETRKTALKFGQLPLGCFLYINIIRGEAAKRGIETMVLLEKAFQSLQEKNVTTLLVGNTHWDKTVTTELEGNRKLLDLAGKYGIKIILQPSSTYFRPKATLTQTQAGWNTVLNFAREYFTTLDAHPALLGWSFKEEVGWAHAPWLEAYYRQLHELKFAKPIMLTNNRLASARYPFNPAPEVYGFDRYYFKYVSYLGFLRSPRSALEAQIRDLNQFFQASVPSGSPLIYVGPGVASHSFQAEEEGNIFDEKRGWTKDPATGKWSGCMRYYPPPGGMRAQMWASIAVGAKGFLAWLYNFPAGRQLELAPRSSPDSNPVGLGCDRTGNEPPQFREFGATNRELLALGPLILNMNRKAVNAAGTAEAEVYVTTHAIEDSGETIIAVVNLHLGTVNGRSPQALSGKDPLSVDFKTGQLTGFTTAPARTIALTVPEAAAIFDLKKNQPLPVKAGQTVVTLEPGEGTLLLLGNERQAQALRARLYPPAN
jgi:hypothetical protein